MGQVISKTPCWGLHWRCGFLREEGTTSRYPIWTRRWKNRKFPVLDSDLESLFQAHALLLRCSLAVGKSSNCTNIRFQYWIFMNKMTVPRNRNHKITVFFPAFSRFLSTLRQKMWESSALIDTQHIRPIQRQQIWEAPHSQSPRSPGSCMEEVWNVSFIVCIFGSITCIFQDKSEEKISTPIVVHDSFMCQAARNSDKNAENAGRKQGRLSLSSPSLCCL